MKRKPTSAELRLWMARIRAERAAGKPESETNQILARMIQSWIAVRDNYAEAANELRIASRD
jgi:hypothetical protein